MSETTLAQRLREAACAATKGEWSVDGYNTAAVIFRQHGKTSVTDWLRLARCDYDNANWKADAAYMALASPENVVPLLDELTRITADNKALTAENETLQQKLAGEMQDALNHAHRADRISAELAEARRLLKPFAKRAVQAIGPGYMSTVKDEWLIDARSFLASKEASQ